MLPVLQDESDLLLDEAPEGLDTPGVEILGEDVEDGVAPPEDRLPQLPGLVQLLLQLVSPLQLQPLQGKQTSARFISGLFDEKFNGFLVFLRKRFKDFDQSQLDMVDHS